MLPASKRVLANQTKKVSATSLRSPQTAMCCLSRTRTRSFVEPHPSQGTGKEKKTITQSLQNYTKTPLVKQHERFWNFLHKQVHLRLTPVPMQTFNGFSEQLRPHPTDNLNGFLQPLYSQSWGVAYCNFSGSMQHLLFVRLPVYLWLSTQSALVAPIFFSEFLMRQVKVSVSHCTPRNVSEISSSGCTHAVVSRSLQFSWALRDVWRHAHLCTAFQLFLYAASLLIRLNYSDYTDSLVCHKDTSDAVACDSWCESNRRLKRQYASKLSGVGCQCRHLWRISFS